MLIRKTVSVCFNATSRSDEYASYVVIELPVEVVVKLGDDGKLEVSIQEGEPAVERWETIPGCWGPVFIDLP